MSRRPGLFDPCSCGSGKRYHACCKALDSDDPTKLTALAVRRHAAGDLAAAERAYRKALALDEAHPDAARNLAILLTGRGAFEEAERLLQRCLQVDPHSSAAYFALGSVLSAQQRLEAAAEAYRAASDADPSSLPALVNLGSVLAQLGRRDRAIEVLERARALDPRNPDAAQNLALLRSDLGDHAGALALAAGAAAAGVRYRRVHGRLALRAGALEQALEAWLLVLAAHPEDFEARVNAAACLADLGRAKEAIPLLEHALRLAPDDAHAWCNLALARVESGRLAAASEAMARATVLAPRDPMVIGHQALLSALEGRLPESAERFRDALEGDPANVSYCIGLASVRYELEGPAGAAQTYQAFVERHPESTSAHFELAAQLLQLGRFAEAWPHYQHRHQTRFRRAREEGLPPLAALRGRRLVLRFEQGLGDQLFFLRFVPAMRALTAAPRVDYISKAELCSLASRAEGIDAVVETRGTQDEPGLLLGDLPQYVMSRPDVPLPPPVLLAATDEARARARALLAHAGPGPYLAVTWEAGSSPAGERDRRFAALKLYKRIDPATFAQALAGWPGTVLSLQRHPAPADREAFAAGLGRDAADLSAVNQDLELMLAVLEIVDEYVGVSNTNMHLRAATGRAARVLVPYPYEWRWMYEGDTSPWFPGFRIYRQTRAAGWKDALAGLAGDLATAAS